jgi:hypothetical protein
MFSRKSNIKNYAIKKKKKKKRKKNKNLSLMID